jgi:hypothetical protein
VTREGKRAKGQRAKFWGGTTDAKTDAAVAEVGIDVVAIRRAANPRIAVPGAATSNASRIISSSYPGGTIGWGSFIAAVPHILAPFPDVAVHVIETKIISWITTNFSQFLEHQTPSPRIFPKPLSSK